MSQLPLPFNFSRVVLVAASNNGCEERKLKLDALCRWKKLVVLSHARLLSFFSQQACHVPCRHVSSNVLSTLSGDGDYSPHIISGRRRHAFVFRPCLFLLLPAKAVLLFSCPSTGVWPKGSTADSKGSLLTPRACSSSSSLLLLMPGQILLLPPPQPRSSSSSRATKGPALITYLRIPSPPPELSLVLLLSDKTHHSLSDGFSFFSDANPCCPSI